MNLYELSASYQQIQTLIEDGQDGLNDTLESINDAIEAKAVGYAKVIKNLEAQTKALKDEENRLGERRKSIESNVKHLKTSLENAMNDVGMRRIKTDFFTFNIQNNPPSVNIVNAEAIPAFYLIEQDPTIDKKSILASLKNGEAVPGAELKQTEGLRIK